MEWIIPGIAAGGFLLLALLLMLRMARLEARAAELLAGQERVARELREEFRQEMARVRQEAAQSAHAGRVEQSASVARQGEMLGGELARFGVLQGQQLEAFSQQLARLTGSIDGRFEQLRQAVEARLASLQADNAARLETMRQTVDEKLHATLEQRLGESFRLVSERLEQVQRGLGEMNTLAAGVGDLKRVLTNVKTRGTWGEVQLEALLEQVLVAEQFARNVATRPGSAERVEFALRLPGREFGRQKGSDGAPVWLPIDAKFPIEDYQRLLDAQDRVDTAAVEAAAKALEARLRLEARSINEKYLEPPHTTDFAILYLPIEGLYAEALRRPGLAESLQRDFRISLAGPTTLAALLNSLQMGFRTLAIERRSAEVWAVLGAVKTEFGKFGEALEATRKKLELATRSIDAAGVRTRQIERKLKSVEALPLSEAQEQLGQLTELSEGESVGEPTDKSDPESDGDVRL